LLHGAIWKFALQISRIVDNERVIKRDLASKILEWAGQYPVVRVTGPRQSGKTTLVKSLFPEHVCVSPEEKPATSSGWFRWPQKNQDRVMVV